MKYEFVINGEKKLMVWPENSLESAIFEELFRDTDHLVITRDNPQTEVITIKKHEKD